MYLNGMVQDLDAVNCNGMQDFKLILLDFYEKYKALIDFEVLKRDALE